MKLFSVLSIGLLTAISVQATIIHVPTDQPTIQSGIYAAGTGDTVLITAGIYTGTGNENIIMNKSIVLKSADGPGAAVIDGDGSGQGISMSFTDSNTVIDGLRITNCRGSKPPALYLNSSDARIINCIFDNNIANSPYQTKNGGAVGAFHGAPRFDNCLFEHNTALADPSLSDDIPGEGGGLFCLGAQPEIVNCVFRYDAADIGGAIECALGDCLIRGCVFIANHAASTGAAIDGQDSITIDHCTFYDNGEAGERAILLSNLEGSTYSFTNCNIAYGGEVVILDGAVVNFQYCNIYGNESGDWLGNISGFLGTDGNISQDPLFCDTAAGALTLAANSPCLNTGEDGTSIGAYDSGCGSITDIDNEPPTIPAAFSLSQNRPNPFNAVSAIGFSIARATYVSLVVYNIIGEPVKSVVSEYYQAGEYEVFWDGTDNSGRDAASGIYIYRLQTDAFDQSRKLTLLK